MAGITTATIEKVELDYEYMKNANFIMNTKIVLKTFVIILFPRNIKH